MSCWAFAWPSLGHTNVSLLSLFLLLILLSFLNVLPPHFRGLDSRSHHRERLVNELLASYHIACFGYYVAVLAFVMAQGSRHLTAAWVDVVIGLNFVFTVLAIWKARGQEQLLQRMHRCEKGCNITLTGRDRWQLYGWTVVRAGVSFILALALATHPALAK